MVSASDLLLYTEAHHDPAGGRWRFAVRRPTGRLLLEAADVEVGLVGPRLDLLAAVRGLEALEFPSRVILITSSSYVRRGINYGLESWRQSDWTWEWFGQMVPVKNRDLWQRVDRALEFHQLDCRHWRLDRAQILNGPHRRRSEGASQAERVSPSTGSGAAQVRNSRTWQRGRLRGRRWLANQTESLIHRLSRLGTGILPQPWFD